MFGSMEAWSKLVRSAAIILLQAHAVIARRPTRQIHEDFGAAILASTKACKTALTVRWRNLFVPG